MARTDQQTIRALKREIKKKDREIKKKDQETEEMDQEIGAFQDRVRGRLLQAVDENDLRGEIDGTGSDGDWTDLTECEVRQGIDILTEEIDQLRLQCSHLTIASRDVMGERARQVAIEGWAPDQDDRYIDRELAKVASCYVQWASLSDRDRRPDMAKINGRTDGDGTPCSWPMGWSHHWWKPTTHRRDLIKAGALILAEIERLDRAAAKAGG